MTEVDGVLGHALVGVDQNGKLCQCGELRPTRDAYLEHVYQVAVSVSDVVDYARRRRAKNADRVAQQRRTQTQRDLDRARRMLRSRQARHEILGAELDRLGITSFVDRADWLAAHRTPDEQLAYDRMWRDRIVEAVRLLPGWRFRLQPQPVPPHERRSA